MPLSPAQTVYLAPCVCLVFTLAAGVLFLRWHDLTGVLLVLAGLVSTVGLFVRARQASINIQMDDLRVAEKQERRWSGDGETLS